MILIVLPEMQKNVCLLKSPKTMKELVNVSVVLEQQYSHTGSALPFTVYTHQLLSMVKASTAPSCKQLIGQSRGIM